jgi:hypothetical protein
VPASLHSLMLATLVACGSHDASRTDSVAARTPAAAATPLPPATDSAATIAAFEQITAHIDRDTLRFDRVEQPISLGAGASGLATGWRTGTIWQRLRVDGDGSGFRSTDTYWYSNGALLGARLETTRTGKKPTVDQVWFRDRKLYRWRDPVGRHLEPAARSTQYEVLMLRARVDTLLRALTAPELTRQAPR